MMTAQQHAKLQRSSSRLLSSKAKPVLTLALGLLVACAAFVIHMRLTRVVAKPSAPPQLAGHLVSDDVGGLNEVLMHYVPELEPVFDVTYKDFLGALPPETRIVFVIQRGRRASLDAFLRRIGAQTRLEAGRGRVVELDVPIGIWSKDRALVLASDRDPRASMLLVPPKPQTGDGATLGASGSSRPFDWQIIPAVARAMPDRGFEVKELPLAFDAGDFAIAGNKVIFDANLLGRNRTRGYATAAALHEKMRALLGRDVVMLGTEEGDVPRHHMSMYMAPLPGGTVLVGDPSLAERIVGKGYAPGETSVETGQALTADFSAATQARFDRAARDLTRAGFHIVRIPNVPFDDKTYFAYTNGVYETRGGHRRAWVPKLDVPDLDHAAFRVYEDQGFEVIPVNVRKVYPQHGTIGCLVNVLSRS